VDRNAREPATVPLQKMTAAKAAKIPKSSIDRKKNLFPEKIPGRNYCRQTATDPAIT
jgi:hypothetical protein